MGRENQIPERVRLRNEANAKKAREQQERYHRIYVDEVNAAKAKYAKYAEEHPASNERARGIIDKFGYNAPLQQNSGALDGKQQQASGLSIVSTASAAEVNPNQSTPAASATGQPNGVGQPPVPTQNGQSTKGAAGSKKNTADTFIKSRGTPHEHTKQTMYEGGSSGTLATTEISVNAANKQVGAGSDDPAAGREEGERINKQLNVADAKEQKKAKDNLYMFFHDTTERELKEGQITKEEKNERDAQFTKFLGGMSRQEFGLFLFDWGSRMMMNSIHGFGPAFGAASLGALSGHMGRRRYEKESALQQQQYKDEYALKKETADTVKIGALANQTRAETERRRVEIAAHPTLVSKQGWVPYNFDTDAYASEPIKGGHGETWIPSTLGGRPSVAQSDFQLWVDSGILNKKESMIASLTGQNPWVAWSEVQSDWLRLTDDNSGQVAIPGKPGMTRVRDLTKEDKDAWILKAYHEKGFNRTPDEINKDAKTIPGKPSTWSIEEWLEFNKKQKEVERAERELNSGGSIGSGGSVGVLPSRPSNAPTTR